jgi:hypothetical protein
MVIGSKLKVIFFFLKITISNEKNSWCYLLKGIIAPHSLYVEFSRLSNFTCILNNLIRGVNCSGWVLLWGKLCSNPGTFCSGKLCLEKTSWWAVMLPHYYTPYIIYFGCSYKLFKTGEVSLAN